MPDTEMVVIVAGFTALALTIIHLIRLATAAVLHRTLRAAIDRDPAMAQSLMAGMVGPTGEAGDDRTALLLIAVGAAMVIASLVIGDTRWMHYAIAGAVFPLLIGTALWVRHAILARTRRDPGQ